MINCIIGSIIGTLLGLCGSFYIIRYQLEKDEKKWNENIKKLIDDLTTFNFKLKVEDVI